MESSGRAEQPRGLRLRTIDGTDDERHASALELFFDLVFVVAIAALAESLIRDPTRTGLLHYIALFIPVWWAWVGFTFYADRFDNDDLPYRLIMLATMLAVAAVAVTIPRAFSSPGGSARFAASYVVVRVLLIALYVRAHYGLPAARPLTARYLAGFTCGAAVWFASVFVPSPLRHWMWAAGLLAELTPPLISAAAIARVPFHVSHIPERFGAFTIIVLGEAVSLDVLGIRPGHLDPTSATVAAGGFLLAAALWWLYFDRVDASPLRHWILTGQAYVYGHLIIFAGINAVGVGVLLATRTTTGTPSAAGARWALCGGLAAFLFAIGVIQLVNTTPRGDGRAWSRLVMCAAFIVLGALGRGLAPLALEAILLLGLSTQIVIETRLLGVPAPTENPDVPGVVNGAASDRETDTRTSGAEG